jgi:anaerobic selenocysteine-containing dehydrogenase
MGFDDPFFRRTDEQMIADAYDWSAPALAGITPQTLAETGWARLNLPDADHYAPHAEGGFPTPSGKHEFAAAAAAGGNFVLPLFRQGSTESQPGGVVDPLPHYIPPRRASPAYPLSLISPKSHAFLNSSYGNLGAQQRVQGEPTALVHPDDATARGITEGELIRVFNERGEFVARAVLSEEVAAGVVLSSMGGWRAQAKGLSTVNAVSPVEFADLGNAPTFSDTRVEVAPA